MLITQVLADIKSSLFAVSDLLGCNLWRGLCF